MSLSPLAKRNLAFVILMGISLLFIGSTVYQAYFANTVDSLYYLGEIEEFSLPSTTGEYNFVIGSHKVTVVSFMYTKCPGDVGCALLTANMAELESEVKDDNLQKQVEFVSIDFDFINDTMQDLQEYAKKYTNDFDFWHFTLGSENETDAVADQFGFYFEVNNSTSALLLDHGDSSTPEPYVHLMVTYLLDREGNIRRIISGTEWNFRNVVDSIKFLVSDDWKTGPN